MSELIHSLSKFSPSMLAFIFLILGAAVLFCILLFIPQKKKSSTEAPLDIRIRENDEDGNNREYTVTIDEENLNKLREALCTESHPHPSL